MLLKSNNTGCIHIQIYAQVHILNYVVFYTDIANTIRDIERFSIAFTVVILSEAKNLELNARPFARLRVTDPYTD